MSNDFKYDDKNLQQLFVEMDPKKRLRALKGAFRAESRKVRNVAVSNLRSSVNSNRDLEKGIRSIVFKRTAGFKVTVAPSAKKNKKKGILTTYGYHKNRYGREKPLLLWFENGAPERKTRGGKNSLRKGHSTGHLKRYAFLQKTASQVSDQVTKELKDELFDNIKKTAYKYGCR